MYVFARLGIILTPLPSNRAQTQSKSKFATTSCWRLNNFDIIWMFLVGYSVTRVTAYLVRTAMILRNFLDRKEWISRTYAGKSISQAYRQKLVINALLHHNPHERAQPERDQCRTWPIACHTKIWFLSHCFRDISNGIVAPNRITYSYTSGCKRLANTIPPATTTFDHGKAYPSSDRNTLFVNRSKCAWKSSKQSTMHVVPKSIILKMVGLSTRSDGQVPVPSLASSCNESLCGKSTTGNEASIGVISANPNNWIISNGSSSKLKRFNPFRASTETKY